MYSICVVDVYRCSIVWGNNYGLLLLLLVINILLTNINRITNNITHTTIRGSVCTHGMCTHTHAMIFILKLRLKNVDRLPLQGDLQHAAMFSDIAELLIEATVCTNEYLLHVFIKNVSAVNYFVVQTCSLIL